MDEVAKTSQAEALLLQDLVEPGGGSELLPITVLEFRGLRRNLGGGHPDTVLSRFLADDLLPDEIIQGVLAGHQAHAGEPFGLGDRFPVHRGHNGAGRARGERGGRGAAAGCRPGGHVGEAGIGAIGRGGGTQRGAGPRGRRRRRSQGGAGKSRGGAE